MKIIYCDVVIYVDGITRLFGMARQIYVALRTKKRLEWVFHPDMLRLPFVHSFFWRYIYLVGSDFCQQQHQYQRLRPIIHLEAWIDYCSCCLPFYRPSLQLELPFLAWLIIIIIPVTFWLEPLLVSWRLQQAIFGIMDLSFVQKLQVYHSKYSQQRIMRVAIAII